MAQRSTKSERYHSNIQICNVQAKYVEPVVFCPERLLARTLDCTVFALEWRGCLSAGRFPAHKAL